MKSFRSSRAVSSSEVTQKTGLRSYKATLATALIIITCTVVIVVAGMVFQGEYEPALPRLDLSSVLPDTSHPLGDPGNPCIVLQEHIELTRTGSYKRAYEYFGARLKEIMPFDQFRKNIKKNSLLFRNIAGYEMGGYSQDGDTATASGRVTYLSGDNCKVKAAFAKEQEHWKISQLMLECEQ